MASFLIDENLSPLIAKYLRRLGYGAKAVRELGLKGSSDEEIMRFSKEKGFVIVTGDIEFGGMFYRRLGEISIIILRSKLQNKNSFIKILSNLHKNKALKTIKENNSLIIASEKDYRIRKFV